MVEGILGPIVQLMKWIIIGCVAAVAIKVIATFHKDKRLKERISCKDRELKESQKKEEKYVNKNIGRYKYDTESEWPFIEKKLITKTEEIVFRRLKAALPNHEIMSQVQLSQLVDVKKGHNFYKWFNRINRMSVDFVVLDKNLYTLAVIEVDDASHRDPKRMEADHKKNKVLKSARVKILRWEPSKIPEAEQIEKYFKTIIERSEKSIS